MSFSYQLKSHPTRLLFDHLRSVATLSSNKMNDAYSIVNLDLNRADLVRVSYITGGCHDIGKGTTFFQNYLKGQYTEDPILKSHSMISSLYSLWAILNDKEISEKNKEFLALSSALAIQGHHNSLKRPITYLRKLDVFDDKGIFLQQVSSFENLEEMERISANLRIKSFKEFSIIWQDQIFDLLKIIRRCIKSIESFQPFYTLNLLYSCLLDADRMDVSFIKSSRTNLDEKAAFNYVNKINDLNKDKDVSLFNINDQRRRLFFELDKQSRSISLNDRVLTLTASTGLGKTLASIHFALNLRKRVKEKKNFWPRIIYVAPFISILDQNVKVFENLFEKPIQNNMLLLHHHLAPIEYTNLENEEKTETYSTPQSELLIQGWNSEIISTTFIQFFNGIFGNRTSHLRRFHNMAGSIVILDEIQSIPFEYWNILNDVLSFLSEKFQFTFILMTATQPLIFSNNESKELVPKTLLTMPERVKFCPRINIGKLIYDFCKDILSIIENNKNKSVLVELNTIRSALEVFNFLESTLLVNSFKLFFLSSQIIPKHRKPRIDTIKKYLDDKIPIILVSTQVVEAGVDLDFSIAIRDIGPIDSVVQTAGRCNRNGLRKKEESPFFIYRIVDENNSELAKKIYGRISIDIANELISKEMDLSHILLNYYNEVKRRRSSSKSESIKTIIKSLNYDDIQKEFNLIENNFRLPIFIEFDEEAEKILNSFIDLSQEQRPTRSQMISIRHQMEHFMIGVSERDLHKINYEMISGIYVIKRSQVNLFYNEMKGLMI